MALPLTQSVFQPTDWDSFLDEIGFIDQSPESREDMIEQILQTVEYAFVTKLFRKLNTKKQIELVKLMDAAQAGGNYLLVNQFLEAEIGEVETIIDEVIEHIKEDYRKAAAGLPDTIAKHLATIQKTQDLQHQTAQEIFASQTGGNLPPSTTLSSNSDDENVPFPWEEPAQAPGSSQDVPSPVLDETPIPAVAATNPSEPAVAFPWEIVPSEQGPVTADPLETIDNAVTDTDKPADNNSSRDIMQDELDSLTP